MLLHVLVQHLRLFYHILQGFHKEGVFGILAGKGANIGNLFCTTPKALKLHELIFGINKKYWAKKLPEGGHTLATRVGGAPYPLGAPPASWAPWWPSDAHLLLYGVFYPGKNHKQAQGTKLRRHEAEPWQNQSRAPVELFCRETSLREGEIITIVITNDPLIGRGSISINIFTSTISSQTLVHLLYPIFVSKPQIGTCGLLVVLITPCTWC